MKEITPQALTKEEALLCEAARQATTLSYSPYSHFRVGAAVLLDNGKIIKGANQENASYPVGICAERATLATAQNLYPNIPVRAIAIAAQDAQGNFTNEAVTPCGMCRQAIAECEKRYQTPVEILMTSQDKIIVAKGIDEILPLAFA